MAIEKYSIVKIIGTSQIGYVQDYEKIEGVKLPENLSTEELVDVENQLKLLANIFSCEVRRRAYDIEKNKTRSKYFNDDFSIHKK